MTSATAPVAAEIIAGRPPTKAMVTAMVKEANNPRRGSTPAMIEKEMASGISARATTRPASTSVRSRRGERKAARTVVSESSWKGCPAAVVDVICSDHLGAGGRPRAARDSTRHCAVVAGATREVVRAPRYEDENLPLRGDGPPAAGRGPRVTAGRVGPHR